MSSHLKSHGGVTNSHVQSLEATYRHNTHKHDLKGCSWSFILSGMSCFQGASLTKLSQSGRPPGPGAGSSCRAPAYQTGWFRGCVRREPVFCRWFNDVFKHSSEMSVGYETFIRSFKTVLQSSSPHAGMLSSLPPLFFYTPWGERRKKERVTDRKRRFFGIE